MNAYSEEKLRLLMQLRRNGITDTPTLSAIEKTPREQFVNATFVGRAYEDTALPIDAEQTISQPTIVGLMTQALMLEPRHMVLEIGTGSGYQAAVLAQIARRVHTIERHEMLHRQSLTRFEKLKLRNVTCHLGDGSKGWPHAAPYERIIVTAAAEDIPPTLVDQLTDGGIMVVPIGEDVGDQKLIRVRKVGSGIEVEEMEKVRFVPLVHA